jgi:sugar fermentation stimulation protein A
MDFEKKLIHGRLIKRYKRFLADVVLDDGTVVVAHCTNTGAMTSCLEEGAEVYLTPVDDQKRKTRFTWEMISINDDWVGINTGIPNKLAFEAISQNMIVGLEGYSEVKREVTWEDSRFDVMAKNESETCFIEVKNVSMKEGHFALFPDAVTSRGQKHLEALIRVKASGMRAVMLYVVQRSDVDTFSTADRIDPAYGETLRRALKNGVEVFVVQARVTPTAITITKQLPVEL